MTVACGQPMAHRPNDFRKPRPAQSTDAWLEFRFVLEPSLSRGAA